MYYNFVPRDKAALRYSQGSHNTVKYNTLLGSLDKIGYSRTVRLKSTFAHCMPHLSCREGAEIVTRSIAAGSVIEGL